MILTQDTEEETRMGEYVVYVISDLHLGGDPHSATASGGRGFRMFRQSERLAEFVDALTNRAPDAVELVINGDFIDFLAERDAEGRWQPFHRDPADATRILRVVIHEREPEVFGALRRYVAAGHRLVIILGNHDVEMSLPSVRDALREFLCPGRDCRLHFVFDGEAYVVGKALIEHGNRCDLMNRVDHDALRRVRVMQSMHADGDETTAFVAPVGSRIVAELVNPLKVHYPFVDLLKPEVQAMAPILVVLDPTAIRKLPELLRFLAAGTGRALVGKVIPRFGDDISSVAAETVADDAFRDALSASLGDEDASELLRHIGVYGQTGGDISASPSALRALSAFVFLRKLLAGDRTFDMIGETVKEYREAASRHVEKGFQAVVFGHTHRACAEVISNSTSGRGIYLNTGTWADLVQVPEWLLTCDADALGRMRRFLDDVESGNLDEWIVQRATFARLVFGEGGTVLHAEIRHYAGGDPDNATRPSDSGPM